MTWLIFVLAVFAVSRCADIIAEEEGPFSIFRRVRRKVPASTNAGRGIRCPFCLGLWLSAIVTAWLWYLGYVPLTLVPVYLFGIAGAAAVLKQAFW